MFKLNANGADALPAPAREIGSNRRDWKYFDEKLAELRVNDVENIIARGRILIEAHEELERGSYEATVKRHFDLSYARRRCGDAGRGKKAQAARSSVGHDGQLFESALAHQNDDARPTLALARATRPCGRPQRRRPALKAERTANEPTHALRDRIKRCQRAR